MQGMPCVSYTVTVYKKAVALPVVIGRIGLA